MTGRYRVMTVCTGNICRSPMAAVVLRARLAGAGLADEVVVDSTGVSDEERGHAIDRRARRVLVEHGYPAADDHRARQARAADLAANDLILPMTAAHARVLRRLAGDGQTDRIVLLRRFDPSAPHVDDSRDEHRLDIDDPWYGGPPEFEDCLAQIEAAADGVVAFVRTALAAR
ncbi:MAG TPA: low molecular weight protein-tyrosine-phosphatase [Cellulomonas sp.]